MSVLLSLLGDKENFMVELLGLKDGPRGLKTFTFLWLWYNLFPADVMVDL